MSLSDMARRLKNMRGEMKRAREALAKQNVIGKAGNGLVSIEINGAMKVNNVKINPGVFAQKDVAGLEELIAEAVAEALCGIQKLAASQMGSITGLADKKKL
jgi:DNA-binding YbaB/EbfC family protein